MSDAADDLLAFIDASPTPFHAVETTVARLEAAGFRALDERSTWSLAAGDKVYVVRGGTSVAALSLGSAPPSEAGFRLLGAHTDSPNFRLKPNPQRTDGSVTQLAVEPYGGVLLHTWLDRDLGVSGRIVVRAGETIEPRLVSITRPIARVPSLAIHLDRGVNEKGLVLNKQDHLQPLFALGEDASILGLLAAELDVAADAIEGFDLCLHDVAPSARGGATGELIYAPRLDNLASCHAGLSALLAASAQTEASHGVVFYDHEEIGSRSKQGADSPFLAHTLERVARARAPEADAHARAMAHSFVISADMAHAVHPNYGDRHEPGHLPRLGAGPVIKTNVNQRYATDGETTARFMGWCKRADVVPQSFVTRSDLGCGSTIGPITSGWLGAATIDVGNPMLSMHSCREMAATADVEPMIRVLTAFFESDD